MAKSQKHQSRRKTPWEGRDTLTPTQHFLSERYETQYKERHPKLSETGEAALINAVIAETCPYCQHDSINRFGQTGNGIQRYRCKGCGKTFTPITGTIFDSHKISISEWMEYCLNIFRYVSINADSWNNRNAFTTSRYWLEKLFLVLEHYTEDIILDGRVWFDETFYTVRSDDIQVKEDGTKPRGLSKNQLCIGVACTKNRILCLLEGTGQPTARKTYMTFGNHIAEGSTLVHDEGKAHGLLIEKLHLISESYDSSETKKLSDKDNPLNRVNEAQARLKNFLYAHTSFDRDTLQGYLNLFSFTMNPPTEHLEKVETLLNLAVNTRKTLRYRSFYHMD
jgi:transposase-like protein